MASELAKGKASGLVREVRIEPDMSCFMRARRSLEFSYRFQRGAGDAGHVKIVGGEDVPAGAADIAPYLRRLADLLDSAGF